MNRSTARRTTLVALAVSTLVLTGCGEDRTTPRIP
jgi:hypothetical protein